MAVTRHRQSPCLYTAVHPAQSFRNTSAGPQLTPRLLEDGYQQASARQRRDGGTVDRVLRPRRVAQQPALSRGGGGGQHSLQPVTSQWRQGAVDQRQQRSDASALQIARLPTRLLPRMPSILSHTRT